jgi:hypothetical protein
MIYNYRMIYFDHNYQYTKSHASILKLKCSFDIIHGIIVFIIEFNEVSQ